MPRAVIFDLDGTLVDSLPDIHAATARLLREEGRLPLSPTTIRGFVGRGLPNLALKLIDATALPGDAASVERLTARLLAIYNAAPAHQSRVYPFVRPALQALLRDGWRIGICTNKPEAPARSMLQRLGLDAYVDAVVGGDTLPVRKPDPAPLWAAAAALGDPAPLFVGDSETDCETAETAGVTFALFTEGYRKTPAGDLPAWFRFSSYAAFARRARGV